MDIKPRVLILLTGYALTSQTLIIRALPAGTSQQHGLLDFTLDGRDRRSWR